jgi:Ca2+-binding RTX toxin-like protein
MNAVNNSLLQVVVNYSGLYGGTSSLTSKWVQVGTSGNNNLNGSLAADDILLGLDGDDYLNGGAGNDYLKGDVGNDVLDGAGDSVGLDTFAGGVGDDIYGIYNSATVIIENAGEGNDTVWTAVNYILSDNVENMYLVGALTGTGNAGNNFIMGYGSDNHTINGGAGNDALYGGAGSDTMNGDAGDDYLIGYDGTDALNGGADNDYLNGGLGADTLNGGTGNDVLDGAGDSASLPDTFAGGVGDDIYGIYNSATVIIENAGEGNDTVWTAVNYTLSDNVENMYLVGALTGTGSAGNNFIMGYGSDNHTINGGAGNDALYGGAGSDIMNGGLGTDNLTGGAGTDTFVLSNVANSVDTISDFVDGIDKLDVINFNVSALNLRLVGSGSAANATNQFIFNTSGSGQLYFDADGAGGAAAIQIAVLSGITSLTAANFKIA